MYILGMYDTCPYLCNIMGSLLYWTWKNVFSLQYDFETQGETRGLLNLFDRLVSGLTG
jgi:hypothetical protein